jgi:hypothetical protein
MNDKKKIKILIKACKAAIIELNWAQPDTDYGNLRDGLYRAVKKAEGYRKCTKCKGEGFIDTKEESCFDCPKCKGTGFIKSSR